MVLTTFFNASNWGLAEAKASTREKIEAFMVLPELSLSQSPNSFIHRAGRLKKLWPAKKDHRSVVEVEKGNYARKHLSQPKGTNLHKVCHFVKGRIAVNMLYPVLCTQAMPSSGTLCYISYVSVKPFHM